MQYRKKPVVIEAITFDELVEFGKNNGANIVEGMPWSFEYKGHPITHENNECYLIPTSEGTMRMTPQDMLITGVKGEIYPCKIDIFNATYDTSNNKLSMRDPQDIVVIQEKATYNVPLFEVTNEGLKHVEGGFLLQFCKGNKADETVFRQPGFFTETLLAVCAEYLRENNVGDLASRDTSIAITHIEDALLRLGKRAADRQRRGVQGTYQK